MSSSSVHDTDLELVELTSLLGRRVRDANGRKLGKVIDVAVIADAGRPRVDLVGVGTRGTAAYTLLISDFVDFVSDHLEVRPGASIMPAPFDWSAAKLRLNRDVLDCQVIDLAGKRVARVCEVLLVRSGADHYVAGVEVGLAGVLRRLGLRQIASRVMREVVDWDDLTLAPGTGRALRFADTDTTVRRLDAAQLASVLAHVPADHAVEILHASLDTKAAEALSATHATLRQRLVHALPHQTAAALVERLPANDAVALLRELPHLDVAAVLSHVGTARANDLHRLMQHHPKTAGGLMNADVVTAGPAEDAVALRARVAARHERTRDHGVVFVLDDDHHPLGVIEPEGLLADDTTVRAVPSVRASAPIEQVLALFALDDYLAVPVIDDGGEFVGAITVDDALEELLAERLPGRSRFAAVRRRRAQHRRREQTG